MGTFYDMSMRITNALPHLIITNDLTVTINNKKSNILNIQCMSAENDRKKAEIDKQIASGEKVSDEEIKKVDDMTFINDALKLLIGEKNAKEIEDMDLPIPEYKDVFQTIMSIATGTNDNTPKQQK